MSRTVSGGGGLRERVQWPQEARRQCGVVRGESDVQWLQDILYGSEMMLLNNVS